MAYVNFNRTKTLEEALEGQKDTIYFTSDTNDIVMDGKAYGGDDLELSQDSVPHSEYNKAECSLTLGYDKDGKLEIQVVRDLAYKLSLSANPTYVWYGSDPTVTFTVTANDYTRDAKGWAFGADGITSASYDKLDPKDSKTFSHTYSDVDSNITGTLTVDSASTVTVQCIKPIICTTSDIASNSSHTDFTKNAGYANTAGALSFSGYTPSVTTLYVGVPGDKTYIKYKSGTSDNEAPRSEQINININGQSLSYSIFVCSVTAGAEFKIYE